MRVDPRILIQQFSSFWHRRRALDLLPFLVLVTGLVSTIAVTEQTRLFGEKEHQQIESTLLTAVIESLHSKLKINITMLGSVVGLFNASKEVSRLEFTTFYETVALNSGQLTGMQGVGFARWIPASALPAFEQRIRQEGFPEFQVRPPGARPAYSATEFLEPFGWRNQRAFGFDMYSEPERRQAMDQAWKTGNASLSSKVQLVQETQEDLQRGVVIFMPIYTDQAQIPGATNLTLLGWAFSPLRMKDMVNSALSGVYNPDLAGSGVLVFDGTEPLARNVLYDNLNLMGIDGLSHPSYEKLKIAGRTWLVGVQLAPRLVGQNGISSAFWIAMLIGSTISMVAALISRILISNYLTTRTALAVSEAASRELSLSSTVFEESSQGILVTNPQGRILMANNAFTQLTGYRISEIKGQGANLLKSGRHDNAFYKQMWDELLHKGFWEGDIWNLLHSGEIRCHHLNISTVRDESLEPQYYVGMLQAVHFMAQHDSLTGLANRSMLMEQLERHLALAKRHGRGVALLYLDLDGFKAVNDQFGHNVGDQVLQIVADRFRNVIREGDLLCRQGGDEFVVLVPEAGSTDQLLKMGWKLVEASRAPFLELDPAIVISASVGVARYPEHGNTSEELLAAADNSMYAAKRAKTNPVQLSIASQPQAPAGSGLLQTLDDQSHQGQGTGQGNQQGDGHG